MAALNYARMLGPGDLPGDTRHPNSPDYVEPAFGLDDAACNVAYRLTKAGDVGELVYEVADACAVIGWVAKNADIPTHYLPAYRLRGYYGLYYRIDRDGVYAIGSDEYGYWTQMFRFTFSQNDEVLDVYCYTNARTYRMTRED